MQENFGTLPSGETATLYTITNGTLTAAITDYGATLVKLLVPDSQGNPADVVLGFDNALLYSRSDTYFGGTIGRCANRIQGAQFPLNGKTFRLTPNDNGNNLHSGPDGYHLRLWKVAQQKASSITLRLFSPDGDQGFPGNARIQVTYSLENPATLRITYQAVCDMDTVFNLTNHSYFNLAGHDQPEKAMSQTLMLPARTFTPTDAQGIPTGQVIDVAGTPMDFRVPKPLALDVEADYEPLALRAGYDHNFEVFCAPCAILQDPGSGRAMAVYTDCPGIQIYSGNYINTVGKGGISYPCRSGIALETQFWPDAVNHPQWRQPITRAGQLYSSVTKYQFF